MSAGMKDVTKLSISFHRMRDKCAYHSGDVTELGLSDVACRIFSYWVTLAMGEVDPYCS